MTVAECIRKHSRELLAKQNVVAVYRGAGDKLVTGVVKKIPENRLAAKDIVPKTLDGIATDVVQTGVIRAFFDPTKRHRPIQPGISTGHYGITAGTIGLVVKESVSGDLCLLSNNHIFAKSNEGEIGDAIYQPGVADGGDSDDTIGVLAAFTPINWEDGGGSPPTCPIDIGLAKLLSKASKLIGRKHRMAATLDTGDNLYDAAICRVSLPSSQVNPAIRDIGVPTGVYPASEVDIGLGVQKYGRTTQHTTDNIRGTDAVIRVQYSVGKTAVFVGQFITGPMSAGGDSGSAVLAPDKRVIGLLFAGSNQITIFSPIEPILSGLGITLVTE